MRVAVADDIMLTRQGIVRLLGDAAGPDQPGTNLEVMDLSSRRTTVIWHGIAGTQDQDPVWSRSQPHPPRCNRTRGVTQAALRCTAARP